MHFYSQIKELFQQTLALQLQEWPGGRDLEAKKPIKKTESPENNRDEVVKLAQETGTLAKTMEAKRQTIKDQGERLHSSNSLTWADTQWEGELVKKENKDGAEISDKVPAENSETIKVDPEVAKVLASKGITTQLDRNIAGQSEAVHISTFLQKNPDVDPQKLLDATGQLFKGMSPEHQQQALAEMTPEQYQEFLQTAVQQSEAIKKHEEKTGEPIDASNILANGTKEKNQFALSSIGASSGVSWGNKWRPSSYGSGRSGKMEWVPSISNSEMLQHCDAIAEQLWVEPAAVKAVVAVESAGKMNATRFEPHIHQRAVAGKYGPGDRTMLATSYGAFQIMWFNHKVCGFDTVESMVDAMKTPQGQLKAFAGFIEGNPRIHQALKAKNWAVFAHGYNGPAYKQNNYDNKMAAAYKKYSAA